MSTRRSFFFTALQVFSKKILVEDELSNSSGRREHSFPPQLEMKSLFR
jgi:hypothetical protein